MIQSLVAVTALALFTSPLAVPVRPGVISEDRAADAATSDSLEATAPNGVPLDTAAATCVEHRSEARFAVGYDHLVHVTNRCEKKARCQVSTNVSPTPTEIEVAPGATETVLTFRGSPASEFTATVRCTLL